MTSPPLRSHGPLFPVVAMIGSVVGLCFPPLLLVTGALGLYSYRRALKDPAWAPRKQVAAMTMAVSAAGLGIFIAFVIPNFKRINLRLQQRGCRDELTRLVEAQKALYAKEHRYSTQLSELMPQQRAEGPLLRLTTDGAPARGTAALDAALPQLVKEGLGLHGECPACSVTMLCAADLDGDPTADVWTVSTIERVGQGGTKIPGFIVWNEVDDVTQ